MSFGADPNEILPQPEFKNLSADCAEDADFPRAQQSAKSA
jgi:hypothetical protein